MNHNGQTNRPERLRPVRGGLRSAAMLALVLALAACATAPPGAQEPVAKRAQARWDAILARDYDAAYALYSPGYRSAVSRTDFEINLRSRRISWTRAQYREHHCENEVCTVTFDVDFTAPRPVPGVKEWDGKSEVEDTWILTSGEWWYVPPER